MEDGAWRRVARESDLAEGVPTLFAVGEEKVMLVRREGKVFAVGHECPHYQEPLEEGVLFGHEIVCLRHHARLDVSTGKLVAPPAMNDLPVYPVRVEGGEVWIGQGEKPRFPKPTGSDPRTFLIVGAGAAGNAAAETLRREGFAGRIVMITAEEERPYDRPELSKGFITGKTKPEWVPLRGPKFYANQGIELATGRMVTFLDPRKKTVGCEGGEIFPFDKALLATGGASRALAIPGAKSDCCFRLRSLADARALSEAAGRAKSVAIIGAGFIGMELASSFRDRGLAVTVVAPEALPLARLFGERVAAHLKTLHERKGVIMHMGKTPTQISGDPGDKTVVLADGSRIRASFVVFGLGIQPAVDYLAGTGLVEGGAVPVNARLETRAPDILAAGDIALVTDDTGEARRIEHWTVAERQGQHAARSMLGRAGSYAEVPFFWTRQAGIRLNYVGYAREFDNVVFRGSVEEGKFLAGYYAKGRLRAACSIGRGRELLAVEHLLRLGAPPAAERLSEESFDLMAAAVSL
jgi:NADPH-dependent 2,4-dienoyl-CoA reductase/sulfur reductase-like enzyme/nitrite reductase/ring-hydroxylating ferredoxin subunit